MKKLLFILILLFIIQNHLNSQPFVDITNLSGGIITAQYNDSPTGENISNIIDNSIYTKFLTFNSSSWVQYKSPTTYIISKYSITSGNDSPERDPLNWSLSGSNNGITFYTIDTLFNQDFIYRNQKREFFINNNITAYSYYRLTMLNNSGDILQVSELELFGIEGNPSLDIFADFYVNSPLISKNNITYINASLNATSYIWSFEGANPVTSSEINPTVVYNSTGNYKVSLIASNGTNTSKKSITVNIKEINDWSSFIYPTIIIECSNIANPGYNKYKNLIAKNGFSTIEEFVKNCCLIIAKQFYYTVEEANSKNLRKITYKLTEGGPLSYKAGAPPNIEIGFDMNYLNTFSQSHSDSVCADEIYGVLCHEISHGYQNEPKNAGVYGSPNEFYGFIEGSADMARLLTGGFNPPRTPQKGGSWKDGYTVTAFFYLWITETKDTNFLRELNKSTSTIDPWSLNAVTQQLFGQSAETLWSLYQASIINTEILFEKQKDIKIYPKPAKNELFINNLPTNSTIKIYDLTGKELINKTTTNKNETINISKFANGIYTIKINDKTTKFVKE